MKLRTHIKTGIVLPFFMLFFSLSLFAQDVKEKLGNFAEVKTFNAVEVEIIPSSENEIVITGHSKNEVKFEIVEDRLEIRLSLDNIWSNNNTKITLYTKGLSIVDANEGSLVTVSGEIEGRELTFRSQEAADIKAERVNAGKVNVKAISGGKVQLNGKAEEQDVEVNTGGHYYGKNLRTQSTDVKSGTAGRAEVYASDYVKATAKLGGTVEIFGRPAEVDKKTSLGGRIL
ncbi:DUF2807 domain-containing protein [Salinimicrobium tongyeongense]|uniref:DUF2807 domain-containing protein n=1 Tax=Salinimicrobium tongyeongense TaxID=2809707 RepID=A0ABY6NVH6_9FLAO|nr:head GIN domain-containing protein [Salinimicrobium tongyeongense]UZH56651.1 DUF2807 domain-containing protein [Salinimicrobium tongyeongense]